MKINKAWIAILLIAIVLTGAAGCKNKQDGKTAVENKTNTTAEKGRQQDDRQGKTKANATSGAGDAEQDAQLSRQTVSKDDSVEVIEGELDDTSIAEEDFSDLE